MAHEMSLARAIGGGVAGSVALTLVNEIGHRMVTESPRLDVLGMRAIVRGLRRAGQQPPRGRVVPALALIGDLVSNALVYGLAVRRRDAMPRGLLSGIAAGIGAVLIGPRLGMNDRTGYHSGRKAAMIAFYALGGIAAAAAADLIDSG